MFGFHMGVSVLMFESGGDEAELQDRVQAVARAVSPAAPEKTAQANSCLPAHAG